MWDSQLVMYVPVVGRAENLVVVHDLRLVTAGDGVEQVKVGAAEAPLQHVRADWPCHVRTLDALPVVAYDRLLRFVEVSTFHPALVQYRTMLSIWHIIHFTLILMCITHSTIQRIKVQIKKFIAGHFRKW